jgi:acyl-coenzyme A synthetase/AMP-(fatty) acid ligase
MTLWYLADQSFQFVYVVPNGSLYPAESPIEDIKDRVEEESTQQEYSLENEFREELPKKPTGKIHQTKLRSKPRRKRISTPEKRSRETICP